VHTPASDLPHTPWSVRISGGVSARLAMEIYEVETLLDVVVVTSLAAEQLRGARRMVWNGRHRAIAWGRLPADDAEVTVRFSRGRLGRSRARLAGMEHAAEVTPVGERFWTAEAEGRFDTVTVSHHGLREQRRIVPARPW
jgi:hypothetical protein